MRYFKAEIKLLYNDTIAYVGWIDVIGNGFNENELNKEFNKIFGQDFKLISVEELSEKEYINWKNN